MRKSALGLVAVSLVLFACSSSIATTSSLEPSLEIFSWWTQTGEVEALDALLAVYNERHPDVKVTNAAALDAMTQRERLKTRMNSGDPPDSFQAVSGIDTLRWVDQGKLASLSALAKDENWAEVYPKAVLDILSKDGVLYGVPLNIERDNNLYYNIALLAEHGVTAPKTLEDFYASCSALETKGVIPLAVPAAGWVLALVAVETLMPAVTGGAFYLDYFAGRADPEDPKVAEWVNALGKVLACSNVKTATSSWSDGAQTVFDGDAAMLVMGDWAKGYFEGIKSSKPWVANEDFGVVPGLGSAGYFTFNSAVFTLPKGAPHPKAAKAFLATVGSKQGQADFNPVKGSLPARTDVSLEDYDQMVRDAGADFLEAAKGEAKLLPGYASLTPNEYQTLLNPAFLVFAVGGAKAMELASTEVPDDERTIEAGDEAYLLAKLRVAYGLLKR